MADNPIETADKEEEDEDAEPQANQDQEEAPRRSERVRNPPSERLNISTVKGQSHSGIEMSDDKTIDCDSKMGIMLAKIACTLNKCQLNRKVNVGVQNVVTHALNQAMKKWGQKVTDAALKEMKQLLDHKCFVPIHAGSLSEQECKRVMQLLLILIEKRNGTIKAKHCANGSIQ